MKLNIQTFDEGFKQTPRLRGLFFFLKPLACFETPVFSELWRWTYDLSWLCVSFFETSGIHLIAVT